MWRVIWKHPFWSATGGLVAMLGFFAAMVQPVYKSTPNATLCGFDEKVIQVPPQHEFNECRAQAHGVEKYEYTETVASSSGRVGGGRNQQWWCDQMKNAKQQAVGQPIAWGPTSSWEESSRNFGTVRYNYHCTATASWGPIYVSARSSECSKSPPGSSSEQIPKACPASDVLVGVRILGLSWVGWPWS